MTYITVKEASEKWSISTRRICVLCSNGRIPGAVKKSKVWMIPQKAKKPEDGRGVTKECEVEPVLLAMNPTYFEVNPGFSQCKEGREICRIQNDFYSGNMEKAYMDVCRFLENAGKSRYYTLALVIKILIAADSGKGNEFLPLISKLEDICRDGHSQECSFINYFLGKTDTLNIDFLNEDTFSELKPLISYVAAKRFINSYINHDTNMDAINQEIICRDMDPGSAPLLCAYYHILLSVYYNTKNETDLYEFHIKKATKILSPRGWCVPLAEYSASINLDIIKEIDPKFYKKVVDMRKVIISSYMEIGVFSGVSDKPRMDMNINTKVGYLIAQGKSNDEIADKLGISKYKVKQHIDDLCSVAGVYSRKGIKDFIEKNLHV